MDSIDNSRLKLAIWGLWCVLLFSALFWAYQPGFDAPFYLDSKHHLEDLPRYHVADLSPERLMTSLRRTPDGPLYRPVSSLTFALNYYFANLDTSSYRLVNVAIHFASALALLFMLFNILRCPMVEKQHPAIAKKAFELSLLAAFLWALHPIHINAVTYVIQRMAALSGLFVFLSVGSYVRGRLSRKGERLGWFLLATVSCLAALFSKANGTLALPLCLIVEGALFVHGGSLWANKNSRILLLCSVVAVVAAGVFIGPVMIKQLKGLAAVREFSIPERLLSECRIQFIYLSLLLFPDYRRFQLDADIPISHGLLSPPTTLLSLAALIALAFFAIRSRRSRPLVYLGILWFFTAQLLESTVIPLELYFEHRMYVPSVFMFLGAAIFVGWLWEAKWVHLRQSLFRFVAVTVVIFMLSIEAGATYSRNVLWGDPLRFANDALSKAPNKERVVVDFSLALINQVLITTDETEKRELMGVALYYLLKVQDMNPDNLSAKLNIALIYKALGDYKLYEEKIRELATRASGVRYKAASNLAEFLERTGRKEEAFNFITLALEDQPNAPKVLVLYASMLVNAGQYAEALEPVERALTLHGRDASAWEVLGRLRWKEGNLNAAREAFMQADRFSPGEERFQQILDGFESRTEGAEKL